jgi:hypothetical protein
MNMQKSTRRIDIALSLFQAQIERCFNAQELANLNGTFTSRDGIILRFKDGWLDGDSLSPDGTLQVQPAVEAPGHLEYWRQGRLHRDFELPAIYSENLKLREYWEHGVLQTASQTKEAPDA